MDVGIDIFRRGLCLLSDNKMIPEQQDMVIDKYQELFCVIEFEVYICMQIVLKG